MTSTRRLELLALALVMAVPPALLLVPTATIAGLTREDGVVESIGFWGLAATGTLLYMAGLKATGRRRWMRIAAASFFLVAAGEEISWGQRVFGFQTPPPLQARNEQGETNLHNLDKPVFDRWVRHAVSLAALAGTALLLANRREVLGITAPSAVVIFAWLVVPPENGAGFHLEYRIGELAIPVLLALLVHRRDRAAALAGVVTGLAIGVWPLLLALAPDHFGVNGLQETRETLIALVLVAWAAGVGVESPHPLRQNPPA